MMCPVCKGEMPAPAGRGRPREFCSRVCGERGRQRRRRAAKRLEFALYLDDAAAEERASRPRRSLTAEVLDRRARATEERAQWLREKAEAELRGLPL
jgi:hypothetical protein